MSSCRSWAEISLVLIFLLGLGHGFNVDVPSAITHQGPPGSMFGFSVAQHKDSNISWILVGAPQGDSRQPGVRKAGAVYRCSSVARDTCQLVPFDRQGNNQVEGKQIDEKSNQWFGATVKSSGEDGIILACAPRYTWFSTNRKRRDPVGTCFVAKDSFTEFVEYSPCRTSRWGYHRQGSCQLGLGADVDSDGRRLFLGAVGSWYWQGQLFLVDSRKSSAANPVPFYQFISPGQLYSQSVVTRPDIRWTQEGPNYDDDSYLGYSVAHGEFSGDNESDVAVGMPRGANLTGKVVIYASDLSHIHNITGEQIGAYFGYSLCVIDVDGDGLHDIVIGAPMFTDFEDSSMKIETGRVYVVYQTRRHKFKKWDSVDGTAQRGRFGTSLAALGDINKDGFGDFAVGAPYAGITGDGEGQGAVYIYMGSESGLRKEFTQVIYAENLNSGISTFGFSLSGGRDLDGNQYPDLLVGAYDSDFVAYFRSKPVVRVNCKLSFTSTSKQINLEEKTCRLRDSTPVSCLGLQLCMEYDGIGADENIDFNVQYILDSNKPKDPRMFFTNNEGRNIINQTVSLQRKRSSCMTTQVYLKAQIIDKLTSLEAELRYSMLENPRNRRQLPLVIDMTTSKVEKDSISIQKNCGPDNICIPDLQLKVTESNKTFLMGSTGRIHVDIDVFNKREESYESTLYVTVPPGLAYVNNQRLTDDRTDISILCSPPSPSSNYTLKCDIGNPLPSNAKVRFRLFFQPRYGSEFKSSFDFKIEVNSTNPEEENSRNNNLKFLSLPIRVQTDVEIFGASHPEIVSHNGSAYNQVTKQTESDIGPEVIHVYEVKCDGPSDIEEAEVTIIWPSYTLDGKDFLYLLEQPAIEGTATCEEVADVNPLAVSIQKHSKFQSKSLREHSKTTILLGHKGGLDTEESALLHGQRDGRFGAKNSSFHESWSGSSRRSGQVSRTYSNFSQKTSSSTYSREFSSRAGSNNLGHSSSEEDFRDFSRRTKRGTARELADELERDLSCGRTKCIRIQCKIVSFAKNSSVLFWLRGRIWSDTFKSEFPGQSVNISSRLITRVTSLPYNVDPNYLRHRKLEIVTTVEEEPDLSKPGPIPWWVYLLAVIGGILFLMLIVYLLYKCGFFKRRRPRMGGPEGQPLHRNNGYHPGDERL